ncbi:MAG TPA: amidohydrolase family protein, partial [Burkholderiaceae bacterium]|nr:amidohydrolase family protein [Burkholderiaceae bacterium]
MNPSPDSMHDVLFTNATVVDGTNGQPFSADVAIRNDRITAVGDLSSATATTVIDATGQVLAPGFIDAHTHDDNVLLQRNDMTPKVSQGVTTVVAGNCGISIAPLRHASPPPPLDLLGKSDSYRFDTFADYLEALDSQPAAVNATCLLGHSTLRAATMKDLDRTATSAEITTMQKIVGDALDAGAIGVSTGIFYPTARAATTEEIIEVCRPLSDHKALYTTHMRDESDHVMESLEESFQIGRALDVRVIISHHKVTGKQNFGRSVETLALISDYMQKQDIGLDVYPYTAASTILEPSMARLASRVMVTWCVPYPEHTGR